MPEGPEIKRIADALEKQIAGRVIDAIYFGLAPLKKWQSHLAGAKIESVETYGKAMLIRLAKVKGRQLNIYSHNQLYGRWFFCDSDNYPNTKRQLRIAIDCQGKSALLYSASEIAVLDDVELQQHAFLTKLGPDVLHRSTTVEHIVERLTSKKYKNRQLGGVLINQSFVAGLGNYLRCEILFYCGIHAKACSRDLDENKLRQLAKAILKLAQQSYQTAGITNNLQHAQQLNNQGASFEEARFYVFRRQNLSCYRCGSTIEKTMQAGQAWFFCPQCQRM